jgi:hypothetical protein
MLALQRFVLKHLLLFSSCDVIMFVLSKSLKGVARILRDMDKIEKVQRKAARFIKSRMLRTLNCHFYKREGSNSDWHSCSRWLRGWCQPYHHPLILSQYQANAEFEPHLLVTLRVQTLWHRMNWTIINALAQSVVILTFIEIHILWGQYTIGTNWKIQLLV